MKVREGLIVEASPRLQHVVHAPAFVLEQRRDASIPIAAVLTGKGNDSIPHGVFISRLSQPILLRGATLPHHTTCPAFGHRERLLHTPDRFSASGRA